MQTDSCLRQLAARLQASGADQALLVTSGTGCSPSVPGNATGSNAALEQSHEAWNRLAQAFQADVVQQPGLLTGGGWAMHGQADHCLGQQCWHIALYLLNAPQPPMLLHCDQFALFTVPSHPSFCACSAACMVSTRCVPYAHSVHALSACAAPAGGELREYQMKGLRWMVGLHHRGLNGILAGAQVAPCHGGMELLPVDIGAEQLSELRGPRVAACSQARPCQTALASPVCTPRASLQTKWGWARPSK